MDSYQMDVFLEQIVERKSTGLDTLKKAGLVLAALVLSFLSLFVFPAINNIVGAIFSFLGIFIVAGSFYGAYYLITSMNIEYEYIMTNGEIDIDKIIARKRRKRLITVNSRHFTEIGLYKDCESDASATTIMACSSPVDEDTYYAKLNHSKHGNCIVVFNPNEKILKSIKQFTKRQIWKV